jgi:hypothetical protein
MLTDLATELLLMPDKIANIQTELLLLNEKQQVLFMKVEIEELKLKMEIAEATDDTGKKLYSNEDSRRAALSTKKVNDPMIQDLNREERHLQTEIQMKKIELEKAANTQRNVRSILSFFSSGIVDSPEFE